MLAGLACRTQWTRVCSPGATAMAAARQLRQLYGEKPALRGQKPASGPGGGLKAAAGTTDSITITGIIIINYCY